MKKLINSVGFASVVASAALLAATSLASAQSQTFAQVTEDSSDPTGNQFAYVNDGPGDAVLTTDPGGVLGAPIAVDFTFLNGRGNGPGGSLAGVKVPAMLTLTSSTASPVTPAGGGLVASQLLTGPSNVLSITADPSVVSSLGLTSNNLLTMTDFTGNLIGVIHGATPQLFGDTELGNVVGYSSAFVPQLAGASQEDYSLAFSSWNPLAGLPGLEIATDGSGNYTTATASAAGTFDFSATVPEPSTTALALGALAVFVGFGRQSRKLTWNRA